MGLKIVILEDNAERQAVMRRCLADRFPQYDCQFFATAKDTIAYLENHLRETLVVSLDHDLALHADANGKTVDDGTGREVADFLASKPACCPVVIHSTNDAGAIGMEMVLNNAHWRTYRVVPFGDLDWIPTLWLRTLRNAVVRAVANDGATLPVDSNGPTR